MDLRPFTSLGQNFDGFTSKKDFSVAYQDLMLKMDLLLQTENFICNSSRRTNEITDAFHKLFLFLQEIYLALCAFFQEDD